MSKLIIFDCDGTLVDSEVIATQFFTKYWATHGVFYTEDEFKETFIGTGRTAEVVVNNFAKMPAHADEEGRALFHEAIKKDLQVIEGIPELLSSLKTDMCVASNSPLNYVKGALAKTQIDSYFGEFVFSAEQVVNPKPAADLFLHAASTCGHHPKDCIVVEDSVSGVLAAKNANMKVIGFTGAGHFIPSLENRLKELNPDWFCSSTDELKILLSSFE
ncbi:HAD family hydrolase [Halobacteriovorax sp.]|uniref:HAD family hydrolase n=1 Tax=Halobacteriovorax sp. TaxID=2020862 RepID=UPI00356A6F7B